MTNVAGPAPNAATPQPPAIVSPAILFTVFAVQVVLIALYLLWSRSEYLPLLINAKEGNTTARLLMLLISVSCLIYCLYFYTSIFNQASYPNLSAIAKFMPFVPVLSLLIMVIFVACVVSQTFTIGKLINSLIAITDVKLWSEYKSVDPWPSLTLIMFGFALSTCLCISNITISMLHINKLNIIELKNYIFYLHLSMSIIAFMYGLTLFATNTAFFENVNNASIGNQITDKATSFGIDNFIINYSIVVIIFVMLVFVIPAARYDTLDKGKTLAVRLSSLTMPAWFLPIHSLLVSKIPVYKQIMELFGLVFPK